MIDNRYRVLTHQEEQEIAGGTARAAWEVVKGGAKAVWKFIWKKRTFLEHGKKKDPRILKSSIGELAVVVTALKTGGSAVTDAADQIMNGNK